jgi:hypothetical protein
MLPEPGSGNRQRREIGVRAGHLDRKPERDGCRARVLLENLDLDALRPHRLYRHASARLTGRQRRERRPHCVNHLVRRIAVDPHGQVRSGIHPLRELLHVLQRDCVDAGNRAKRHMSVWRRPKDVGLEPFPAELLFVRGPQVLDECVELRILQAPEIVVAEPRFEQLRKHRAQKRSPVIAMDNAGERRHLLVGALREGSGHRVQHGVDFVDGHRSRAGAGDHRRGERRKPLLAGRVVRRSGGKEQFDVQLREHGFLPHQAQIGSFSGRSCAERLDGRG